MKSIRFAHAFIYVVCAVIALLVFQVFLRYSYITTARGLVFRIDRVTQEACMIAPRDLCRATPPPTYKTSDFQIQKIDPATVKWDKPRQKQAPPGWVEEAAFSPPLTRTQPPPGWDQAPRLTHPPPGWDKASPEPLPTP
jgi:hypothetical protein